MNQLKPGDKLHGFHVTDIKEIEEYRGTGVRLVHEDTGCEVYHLVTEDPENVFSFNFKTPPADNTGVPHILEHSVLSGSRNYPLKDPFISLMKGSVQTYLNASTYPDKTIYPAATVLKKDYFNLMSVYADAVFFPLLTEQVFLQEGHRIDASEDGSFAFQGIVFSEMQGVYASHDNIVGEWSVRSLFPGSAYGYDYGGSPDAIPDLTYEAFREFHRIHYHPSNCRIFLYGNIPTAEQCAFLQDHFLSRFSSGEGRRTVPLPERWSAPMRVEKTSPLAEGQDEKEKTTILINFRAVPVTDPAGVLGMEVLAEALMGNEGAPITKAVQDSGLGDDLSPVSGLDTQTADTVISIGIRGSEPERAEAFEALIFGELEKLAAGGIPRDVLEGALRRVEFRNREIRGGLPFGLRLMGKALRGWMNGTDPETTMLFTPWMEEVKRLDAAGGYFEGLIRRHVLENMHRSTLVVRPDREHAAREAEELQAKLEEIVRSGGHGYRDELIRRTGEFYRLQEADEPAGVKMPSLSLSDLPKDIRRIDTREGTVDGIPVYSHDLFTNGIVYTDILFDITGLDEESALLLPFFSHLLTSTGLPGVPYDEVARLLTLKTGGLYTFFESNVPAGGDGRPLEYLVFRMKTLEENLQEGLDLFGRILTEAVLDDVRRIADVAAEGRNDFRSSFLHGGHSLAALRAAGRLSGTAAREESWRGVRQFLFLEELAQEKSMEAVGRRLDALRKSIFTRAKVRMHAAGSPQAVEAALAAGCRILSALPAGEASPPVYPRPSYLKMEPLVVESAVGFASSVIPASLIGSEEHPAEVLLGRLLATGFLWERVRLNGGAYGVSAGANGMDGYFSMVSYRDPGVDQTLAVFRQGLEMIASGGIRDDELEKVIITTVGKELRPLSPGEESITGLRRRLYGITDELRLAKHNMTLGMDTRKVRAAAERLLEGYDRGASVVIGGKALVDRTVAAYPEAGSAVTVLPL